MNVNDIIARHAPKAPHHPEPRRPEHGQIKKPAEQRPPIQWEPEPAHVVEGTHVKIVVSRSIETFPRYSIRVGGRSSPYLRPHIERSTSFNAPDVIVNGQLILKEIEDLGRQALAWIEDQLKERKAAQIAALTARTPRIEDGPPRTRVTGKTEKKRQKQKGA